MDTDTISTIVRMDLRTLTACMEHAVEYGDTRAYWAQRLRSARALQERIESAPTHSVRWLALFEHMCALYKKQTNGQKNWETEKIGPPSRFIRRT